MSAVVVRPVGRWVALASGLLASVSTASVSVQAAEKATAESASRKFRFTYAGVINELSPGATARVWLPVAASNSDQTVELTSQDLPGETEQTTEKRYGNTILYFSAKANDKGEIPFRVEYLVTRKAIAADSGEKVQWDDAKSYLKPDKLVPSKSISQRLLKTTAPSGETLEVARKLYDLVDDHMKYDKSGEGWGRGDALWACNSKYGNCTDFHSVFIGLCRDMDIPAKFEMGFPLPAKTGKGEVAGYHCWAKFYSDGRWVGVDISEADKNPTMKDFLFGNLPSDRVMFTAGRDLELSPKPAAVAVNFLIYPYVEVGGKAHAKFVKKFAFEDVK